MDEERTCSEGGATGGGRPPEGGRTEPVAGAPEQAPPSGPSRGRRRSRRRRTYHHFTADERRQAVEAYLQSDLPQSKFARIWGVSPPTLAHWLERYDTGGPQNLERQPHPGKGQSRIAEGVRTEIVRSAGRFPDFGLKKLRDWLYRFQGVRVSAGSIRRTLEAAGVEPEAPLRRTSRARPLLRRFERSRPGSLWQSDITSQPLARPGVRAYLVVFLDDYSRYVVSWALALHQKQELVEEALLAGLDRFGKPEEVLTDQGRQYYSWRGKSRFQKLLVKQGIHHVVARSHHPQTVGKCERLWKTLGEEFWSRVMPRDLEEARARLGHFFIHYNHHRPHQGIGGLVPADRFFGAETEVRKALEVEQAGRELELALGDPPRRRVYLVGRIGDREVSVHGERGRLVIHTPDGGVEELDAHQLGMPGEMEDERGTDGTSAVPAGGMEEGSAEEAGEDPPAALRGMAGAGSVARGERGGAAAGPCHGGGDPLPLAGSGEPPGGGGAVGDPAVAGLAALAAGAVGDGGRSAEAAAQPAAEGRGDAAGGCAVAAAQAGAEAGGGSGGAEAAGGAAAGDAGAPGRRDEPGGGRPWNQEGDDEGG